LSLTAYIGLGANLGDPVLQLRDAGQCISELENVHVSGRSSLYRTSPVGITDQPDFINAVLSVETGLPARELMGQLLEIENQLGRTRFAEKRNGPRLIDCDLLLYGETSVTSPELQLPHPRITGRLFVLAPLKEIAPSIVLPGDESIGLLCRRCREAGQRVERIGCF
jgi:2-amino-4-hydroxy-6-hydroxymethyldihydropteridine diphosphokinase